MRRVLLIKLSNRSMFIYPENCKIIEREYDFNMSNSPCVFRRDGRGYTGYGAIASDVTQPPWFKEPYMYCYLTEEGKLI